MYKCPYWGHLHSRLTELSKKFVDQQIEYEIADPIIFIPDLDQLAAYRLLMHAELEDFLEKKAGEGIRSLYNAIGIQGDFSEFYSRAFLLFSLTKQSLQLIDFEDRHSVIFSMQTLVDMALKEIKNNNGIKSRSFILLSFCAGKSIDQVDQELLASLKSYGKERGEVAHQSVTRTKTLQAPTTEKKNATELVEKLAKYFDISNDVYWVDEKTSV